MRNFIFLFVCTLAGIALACQPASSTKDEAETRSQGSAAETTTEVSQPEEPAYENTKEQYMAQMAANLKNALRNDLLKSDLANIPADQRKFQFEAFDLNEDGKDEYLVGFASGNYFCGSGGCTYYLLDHEGNRISRFTVAKGPFIVLKEKHNGWRDLVVQSDGKLRHLKFDGKKYPNNPSTVSAFTMTPGDGLPRLIEPGLPMPTYEF